MKKISLTIACLLAGAALVAASPADAQGKGWKSGGGKPHGFTQGRKLGWGEAKTPPGWAKGRKRGWGTSTTPPGWSREGVDRRRAPLFMER